MSSISSNLVIEKRYFIIILLIAQLSTRIRHVPSFFGVNSAKTAQGLKLSRMNSLLNNSSTCLCNSACSIVFIRYYGKLGRVAPETKSITCWMFRIGGSWSGSSLGNTSAKSATSGRIVSWDSFATSRATKMMICAPLITSFSISLGMIKLRFFSSCVYQLFLLLFGFWLTWNYFEPLPFIVEGISVGLSPQSYIHIK